MTRALAEKRQRWLDADLHRLDGFAGYLANDEGRALYDLAREVPPDRAIVELGSYKGKSTSYLAAGSMAGQRAPVYAVDLWDNLEGIRAEAQKNGAGYQQYNDPMCRRIFDLQIEEVGATEVVTSIVSETSAAGRDWSGGPVGLLFIDASHDHDSVIADFAAWRSHLADGAVVAFHDYARRFPGVWRAANEIRGAHRSWTGRLVRTLLIVST